MIYVVPIEPIDARYTKQWYFNIPQKLQELGAEVITIDGKVENNKTTPGAFLDFCRTNAYKSEQIVEIATLFENGNVKAGDKFLVTDAWNYAIIAIRYMSTLMNIPVEIHGIWHAGSYDRTDILGMKMDLNWSISFERSLFEACDWNYFGTHFHRDMFIANVGITNRHRAIVSGQPHELLLQQLNKVEKVLKEDIVIWPHRASEDKNYDIAKILQKRYSNFIITQEFDPPLTKEEYYKKMSQCRVIFSCALHENLGISVMEGTMLGCIPVVPNSSSYREMYLDCFKYSAEWIKPGRVQIDKITNFIITTLENYNMLDESLKRQQETLKNKYLNGNVMYDKLMGVE